MDLTELRDTMEKVNKEYAVSRATLKGQGVNSNVFVIASKDLEIILEAAGYYYDRAQEERC